MLSPLNTVATAAAGPVPVPVPVPSDSSLPLDPASPAASSAEPTPTHPALPARTIRDWVTDPGFPKSAVGATVDIGGVVGVVTQVINQSLKLRLANGTVQSFNAGRLRTLYGPAVGPSSGTATATATPTPTPAPRPGSLISQEEAETDAAPTPTPAAAPAREFIAEPDFEQPVANITEFAGRADFPACAYGRHVAIADFTGVVVELVKQSIKVRSPAGITRSFNTPILRRLYGQS